MQAQTAMGLFSSIFKNFYVKYEKFWRSHLAQGSTDSAKVSGAGSGLIFQQHLEGWQG